ncbi:MAG: tyrosine-type recombinase/integrase [Fervidicoccaceae archaeon]
MLKVLDEIIRLFEYKLVSKGRSPSTIKTYLFFVKKFLDFIKKPPPYTQSDLELFFAKLRKDGTSEAKNPYDPVSLRLAYAAMKRFFQLMGWSWPFSSSDTPRLKDKAQPFYTFEDFQKMVRLAQKNPVHEAILWILWLTGCRRSQLCDIKVSDVNLKDGMIAIPGMKGGEPTVWRLPDHVVKLLNLVIGRRDPNSYLFKGKKGKIHPDTITWLVNHYAKKAGIEPKGAHGLRRGRATFLYKELGMRERELQSALGWKTPTMPHKYIQLVSQETRRIIYEKDPSYRI